MSEIELSGDFVRNLILRQHPDLGDLPIAEVGSGWDNATFRLGASLAVRLPRRQVAAALIEREQRWLPLLQAQLPLPVPAPLRIGRPDGSYPWFWSIVPWIDGETVDRVQLDEDQGEALAAFLEALHVPPPAQAPHNPYRGVPLADRRAKFATCVDALRRGGRALDDRLLRLWNTAIEAPIDSGPTWIHGDLHAKNVLALNGRLCGVIDWGDLAQGDRATDLAAVWMLFSQANLREQVIEACKSASADTWRRARGWALLLAVILLASNDPVHATAAEATILCPVAGVRPADNRR